MAQRLAPLFERHMAQLAEKTESATLRNAITGAQLRRGKAAMAGVEKLPAQPRAHPPRNAAAAEDLREFAQDKIGVDAGLGFKIAGVSLGADQTLAFLKKKRGLNAMGNFLDKGDESGNIALIESQARVVDFKFGDDGARIKNGEVKRITSLTQKCAATSGQMAGLLAGQAVEHGAPILANNATFEINGNG